jgi:hypothetical protein
MKKEEVELLVLESGLLWPHYQTKKAWSANTLTKILKEMEYGEIPLHILKRAAENGKLFHQTVQEFFQQGIHPSFVDLATIETLSKVETKIHETINFLKKKKFGNFSGSEKLHYVFHKGELLAAYVDLEFQDYIIELKTSNFKANESPIARLIFEIQLLIQNLCTGKDIYLLWSTGQGVIFKKFEVSDKLLKILDILISLAQQENDYSLDTKKEIVKEIINSYTPTKLISPFAN